MAIEPFRQRIGIASPGSLISGSAPQVSDVGATLRDVGRTIVQAVEPGMKRKAIKAGEEAFAEVGLAKDENGNFTVPETPKGKGLYYNLAFEEAALKQYALTGQDALETGLTRIYSDPNNIGKLPQEVKAIADEYVQSFIKTADPRVQADLFELGSREIRQRDLQRSSDFLRRRTELMVSDFDNVIKDSTDKAEDAYSIGTSDANTEAERLKARGRTALEEKVRLGFASESDLARYDEMFTSVKGTGTFLGLYRKGLANGDIASDDVEDVLALLQGRAAEGTEIMGFNQEEIFNLIPDESRRARLVSILNDDVTRLRREEQEAAEAADLDDDIDNITSGQPFGMSDDDYAKTQLAWAQKNGVNLMTAEGLVQLATYSEKVSPKIYETVFQNMNARTAADFERLRPLFKVMTNLRTRDGASTDISATVMKSEDWALMAHYSAAMEFGNDQDNALAQARAAVSKGVSFKNDAERRNLLRAEMSDALNKKVDEEDYADYMDNDLGAEWSQIGRAGRNAIELEASQLVAMGISFPDALKRAGRKFTKNWTKDPNTLQYAIGKNDGYGGAFVRNPEAVPGIYDVTSNKAGANRDWVKPYVKLAIDTQLGQQVIPGVPDKSKLKLGENVFLRHSGLSTRTEGNGFNLFYYAPGQGGQILLRDKKGQPITLWLGEAAAKQDAFAKNFQRNRTMDMKRGEALRRKSMGFGGKPGENISTLERGKAAQEYRAWKEQFDKRFPSQKSTLSMEGGLGGGFNITRKTSEKPMAPVSISDVDAPPLLRQMRQNVEGAPANAALKDRVKSSIVWAANQIGVNPVALGAVISFETGGKFDPYIMGGGRTDGTDVGNFFGLIQFGPEERKKYKLTTKSTPEEQMKAFVQFAQDRGWKKGKMGMLDLYSMINAGSPGLYDRKDMSGTTVAQKVKEINRRHRAKARSFLGVNE